MDVMQSILDHLAKIHKEVSRSTVELQAQAEVRRLNAGVKPYHRTYSLVTPATSFALDPPDQGFAWNLKIAACQLSGTDSVTAWVANSTSDTLIRLIGYAPAPGSAPAQNVAIVTWSSDQGLLNPGEGIVLKTSGSKNITGVTLVAAQVPAELIPRLLW